MYDEFKHYVGNIFKEDKTRVHIIYNSVGQRFEEAQYDPYYSKEYDFITIRSNMDSSIPPDIVTRLAWENPEKAFLAVEKREWFSYHDKPDNIFLINRTLNHNELIENISKSRFALMPTRRDSQGVMTCEFRTFGMPAITSEIVVCREICSGFDNYILIDNENTRLDLEEIVNEYYGKGKNYSGGRAESGITRGTPRKWKSAC